jgi:undecaprenyl-diphosphatase
LIVVLLIILIGYSRVYLRVHYASDVLAGFIIGSVWLTISLTVLNNLEQSLR